MATSLSSLFHPEPVQWGLRGDPLLWRDMRDALEGEPIPSDPEQLVATVESKFEELTGHSMDEPGSFQVEKYRSHGMSSGGISPAFWRDDGVPLLKRRLAMR